MAILKVFKGYEDKEKYLDWAKAGFALDKAVRYPMGKKGKCLYSLHKGEKLPYLELEKHYIVRYMNKWFEKLVEDKEFEALKILVKK